MLRRLDTPDHPMPMWRRVRRGGVALFVLAVLTTAGAGCKGCGERVINPESPEEAAEIWAQLFCDSRESRVTLEINDLENQHDTAMVRNQLLAGDADGKPRARFLGRLSEWLEEWGPTIISCEHEVTELRTLDSGRVLVDISFDLYHVEVDEDGDFDAVDSTLELTLETTKLDGFWHVTAEPPDAPTIDEFRLFGEVEPYPVP